LGEFAVGLDLLQSVDNYLPKPCLRAYTHRQARRQVGVNGGLAGLEHVNRKLLKRAMKHDGFAGYTLDIDATGIEAEKQSAKMTYKGFTGYMPIVGHLAENGFMVGDEFREGNQQRM
jgi:hypothetical protein